MSVATDFTSPEFAASVPSRSSEPLPRHLHAVGAGADAPNTSLRPPMARLASVSVLCPPRGVADVAPIRLTRRGIAVLSLAVVALGAALLWVAALSAPDSAAAPARGAATVTVRPGDTLWSIAGRVAPQRDSRAEVATLQQLNHLRGVNLVPGQQLHVR